MKFGSLFFVVVASSLMTEQHNGFVSAAANGGGNSGSGGTVQENGLCKVTRKGNSYVGVEGWECDETYELECGEVDDTGDEDDSTVFNGVCLPIGCTGKADPTKGKPHDNHGTFCYCSI